MSLPRKRDTGFRFQRECAKLHRQLLVIAYKYLRCLPCSLIPKGCPGHKSGRIPALLPVNIFCFSIIGGKLKAEKHALWAALLSAACGGASRRCAAPSAAARRFAPPLRGATRPARCARSPFATTKKMPTYPCALEPGPLLVQYLARRGTTTSTRHHCVSCLHIVCDMRRGHSH